MKQLRGGATPFLSSSPDPNTEIEYIPLDYIKCLIPSKFAPDLFANEGLRFEVISTDIQNGVFKETAMFDRMKISIHNTDNRIILSGSIHAFYNNGAHNHDQFSKSCLRRAVNRLSQFLKVEPDQMRILNLECGINLEGDLPVNKIIDFSFQHLAKNRTSNIDCKWEGKYIQFKHDDYIVKLYNKGLHYKLGKDILRVEVKHIRWDKFRFQGFETLKDVLELDNKPLIDDLLHKWSSIVMFNPSNKERKHKYCNHIFWKELRDNFNRTKFHYHFKKLKELNSTQKIDYQEHIADRIKQTVSTLGKT